MFLPVIVPLANLIDSNPFLIWRVFEITVLLEKHLHFMFLEILTEDRIYDCVRHLMLQRFFQGCSHTDTEASMNPVASNMNT